LLSAAQPWLPAPPHTAPAAGRSHGGRTAGRGPGRSWPMGMAVSVMCGVVFGNT
jgi:hypothetical protein